MATSNKKEGGVDLEQRALQEQMAETEFRATLDRQMDPVSALGYEPGKARAIFHPIFDTIPGEEGLVQLNGAYLGPTRERQEGRTYPRFSILQRQTEDKMRYGDVMVDQTGDNPDGTYAHEFRHRGMQRLRTSFSREEFESKYGREAADYLYGGEEESLVKGMDSDEAISGGTYESQLTDEQIQKLSSAMTDAAFDLIEDEREDAKSRKEAVGWLRSLFGRKED